MEEIRPISICVKCNASIAVMFKVGGPLGGPDLHQGGPWPTQAHPVEPPLDLSSMKIEQERVAIVNGGV